ncbi:MAG: M23 family metallopeptidase [Heliobacteriaceae bacterium]|nr:M23 family metallopeptidase [Heliobacteriaceae bacterium]
MKIRKGKASRRWPWHSLTIMVVPGTGKQVQSLNLSPSGLRRLLVAGAVLMGSLVFLLGFSVYATGQMVELHRLRTVNVEQAEQIGELQAFAAGVQTQVLKVKELEMRIRRMVGLDHKENTGEQDGRQQDVFSNQQGSGWTRAAYGFFPSRGRTTLSEGRISRTTTSEDNAGAANLLGRLAAAQDDLALQETGLDRLEKDVANQLDLLAAIPSSYPVRGDVTSPFGWRRSPFGLRTEFHSGLDIKADYGTPVRAAAKGRIIFAGWKTGLGRVVEIEHGHGFISGYHHLSAITVKVGEKVERGDSVGKVGNSGRSTGPHLHFTVHWHGEQKDPQQYLLH